MRPCGFGSMSVCMKLGTMAIDETWRRYHQSGHCRFGWRDRDNTFSSCVDRRSAASASRRGNSADLHRVTGTPPIRNAQPPELWLGPFPIKRTYSQAGKLWKGKWMRDIANKRKIQEFMRSFGRSARTDFFKSKRFYFSYSKKIFNPILWFVFPDIKFS